jgi:hypothetical protein
MEQIDSQISAPTGMLFYRKFCSVSLCLQQDTTHIATFVNCWT